MRKLATILMLFCLSDAALANCNPPAGMMIQQWYSICGPDLQQAYAAGMGQGYPYDAFVQAMYQTYAQPVGYPQGGQMPMPVQGQCNLGASACFNGWFRTCQVRGATTMWITGAQRC